MINLKAVSQNKKQYNTVQCAAMTEKADVFGGNSKVDLTYISVQNNPIFKF